MIKKEEIIASVDKSWPKDLIVRYLYVKLAPTFQRDLKFFKANIEAQYQMYKQGMNFDGTHVYCVTISHYYKNLFAEFGINSHVIQTNTKQVPHHGLIVEGDKEYYFIDPLKDLGLAQLGCKTRFYGIMPLSMTKDNAKEFPYLSFLSQDYLKEMDEALGLLECGIYMDDFFEELHKDLFSRKYYDDILALIGETPNTAGIINRRNLYSEGNNINDTYVEAKIELMNRYLINLGQILGPIERQQFYMFMMPYIFTNSEQKCLSVKLSFLDDIMLTHYKNAGIAIYNEKRNSDGVFRLERRR